MSAEVIVKEIDSEINKINIPIDKNKLIYIRPLCSQGINRSVVGKKVLEDIYSKFDNIKILTQSGMQHINDPNYIYDYIYSSTKHYDFMCGSRYENNII